MMKRMFAFAFLASACPLANAQETTKQMPRTMTARLDYEKDGLPNPGTVFVPTRTASSLARREDAESADSGLAHSFQIAVGGFSADGGASGFSAKVAKSFFRPTRHEAVVSLWILNGSGDTAYIGTAEYRWRFGGHGIAYYALGLGGGKNTNGTSGVVLTAGWGVEVNRVTLELRALSADDGSAASLFLLGYRF